MKILVTGGAGFIGSNLIKHLINEYSFQVLNIDKLTYASNLEALTEISGSKFYSFQKVDICNYEMLKKCIFNFMPNKILHLAAESHVDRSIDNAENFIQTNIVGTYNLLEITKEYYNDIDSDLKSTFRFHHISTDEVFGSLENSIDKFTETSPYDPRSPYAASKASADHLVRAWVNTYSIPAVVSNCSNNYGPWQFPEKLIPLTIIKAINSQSIPVYGDGLQIRDWLFVDDHSRAIAQILLKGRNGETYNIGGNEEKTNLEIINLICEILDRLIPNEKMKYSELITHVEDRPGHDRRYAMATSKINNELNWFPNETFLTGIEKTVNWYIKNDKWYNYILKERYKGERLGLK